MSHLPLFASSPIFPLILQTPTTLLEHDEHLGRDERSHCDDLRQSGGFTQTVTLTEHKAFLSSWCRTFMHTREKEVFFPNTLKISLAQTPPRRTISGDVCGDSADKGAKGIEYTWAQEPGCYENNVCSHRVMHPISLVSDADFDDSTYVDGEKTFPIETPSRISQRRSMKQELSDSTISCTCWWECCVCVWLLWTFCLVLRPILIALWPWRYHFHNGSWSRIDCHRTKTVSVLFWRSNALDTPSTWSSMTRHEAREGYWGAKKRKDRSKYHENESIVPGTWSSER